MKFNILFSLSTFVVALLLLNLTSAGMLEVVEPMPSLIDELIVEGISIEESASIYPPVVIKSNLGLPLISDDIASLVLYKHTATCGESCISGGRTKLYEDGALFDTIDFYTLTLDEEGNEIDRYLQPIRSYQVYIKTNEAEYEEDVFENQCVGTGVFNLNGTEIQECSNVRIGTVTRTMPEWMPYNVGDVLPAGVYDWELRGEKRPDRTIDWIGTVMGEEISEWSVWGNNSFWDVNLDENYGFDKGFNSTIYNFVNVSSGGVALIDTNGIINGSLNLSSDGWILYGSRSYNFADVDTWTTNVWIKRSSTGNSDIYRIEDGTNKLITYFNGGGLHTFIYPEGVEIMTGSGYDTYLSNSSWHMITIRKNSSTETQLYIDGVYNKSVVHSAATLNTFTGQLAFGGWQFGAYTGRIDEFSTFNHSLTSTEIANLYNSGAGLKYGQFATSTITLNSPANNYIPPTNLVTFNATATVVGGAKLINMSLWDNSTGIWKMNSTKTTELFTTFNQSHGQDLNTNDGGITEGYTEYNKLNIGSTTVYLYTVTKKSAANPYKATVWNRDTGAWLANASFVGDNATFSGIQLNANANYTINLTFHNGGDNRRTNVVTNIPYNNGYLTWQGGANPALYYDIERLYISTSPASTGVGIFTNTLSAPTKWAIKACDSDGVCGMSENRTVLIDTQAPTINILYPTGAINGLTNGQSLSLNYSITDSNIGSCWYEYNGINGTANNSNCYNNQTFTYVAGVNSIKVWANDTIGNKGSNTSTWTPGVTVNSFTYNSSTYETSQETFTINASSMTSANLWYNGTSYAATVSSGIATKTLDIDTTIGNKSFFWEINGNYNTSLQYQYNYPIIFNLCNSTNNKTYVNFTFKDEETLASINASTPQTYFTKYYLGSGTYYKTLLFTNNTEVSNMAFCFTPSDKTLNTILDTLQYTSTGYYQRSYYFSGTYTNTTTNQVLYLLSTGGYGVSVSFQVTNTAIVPISGASVTVQRQIAGTWTTVGTGSTDSAGLASFYLSSQADHVITVSKSGFTTTIVTIRPVQSLYTITLGGSSADYYYNTSLEGIYYYKNPASGTLSPGTYTFSLNVTAQQSNMQGCVLNLTNISGAVLATGSGTGTSNCYASVNYAGTLGQNLYGKYYVILNNGNYSLLEGDGNWKFINITSSSYSLKNLINFLSSSEVWTGSVNTETEQYRKYEFTKLTAFFLIFAVFLAFMNVTFSFDLKNPGIALFLVPIVMTLFTIAGGLNGKGLFYIAGATPFTWLDNLILTLYAWIIAGTTYYKEATR